MIQLPFLLLIGSFFFFFLKETCDLFLNFPCGIVNEILKRYYYKKIGQ